jgi:hypothetical protein
MTLQIKWDLALVATLRRSGAGDPDASTSRRRSRADVSTRQDGEEVSRNAESAPETGRAAGWAVENLVVRTNSTATSRPTARRYRVIVSGQQAASNTDSTGAR